MKFKFRHLIIFTVLYVTLAMILTACEVTEPVWWAFWFCLFGRIYTVAEVELENN